MSNEDGTLSIMQVDDDDDDDVTRASILDALEFSTCSPAFNRLS